MVNEHVLDLRSYTPLVPLGSITDPVDVGDEAVITLLDDVPPAHMFLMLSVKLHSILNPREDHTDVLVL